MSVDELKNAVLALEGDEKKQLLLQTLPQLSREVMQDRDFLMQLLPIFMGLIKDSRIDLGQLAQMMMNGNRPPQS
jgi:hypothetical protein